MMRDHTTDFPSNACAAKMLARNMLIVGCALLFCTAAGNATAQTDEGPAVTDQDDEQSMPRLEPGYTIPPTARDPFFPPGSQGPTENDLDKGDITKLETLRQLIRVTVVTSGGTPGQGAAVINGQLVRHGETLQVTAGSDNVPVTLVALRKNPPGVTLQYQEKTFDVLVETP